MSIFYNPGPIPGWPVGRPQGSQPDRQPADQSRQKVGENGPEPEPLVAETIPTGGVTLEQSTAEATPSGALTVVGTTASAGPTGDHSQDGEPGPHPSELRIRTLRDTLQEGADQLGGTAPIRLSEFYDTLWAACSAVEQGDLGSFGALVGRQLEAFFEHLHGLAETHTEPVETNSLGLPNDANFLQDMATYLTERFALDAEE